MPGGWRGVRRLLLASCCSARPDRQEESMRTFSLRGHVALVTGSSRGIGAAIVKTLGEAGCAVVVNYRERAAEAEELAKAIVSAGGKVIAIAADVSKTDAVAAMVQRASSELGPVDI